MQRAASAALRVGPLVGLVVAALFHLVVPAYADTAVPPDASASFVVLTAASGPKAEMGEPAPEAIARWYGDRVAWRNLRPGPAGWSLVASAPVTARQAPHVDAPKVASFPARNRFGDPQVFAAVDETRDELGQHWYRVRLPIRPNGSEGWVPAAGLVLQANHQRLVVDVSDHTITLYEGGVVVGAWPAAVGKLSSPTPTGEFYLWTKWASPRRYPYGSGVLGLNGFSEVYNPTNWPGEARIGIHGTRHDNPGHGYASSGCPRLKNQVITYLMQRVELGTPVTVVA
jgi:lipoprotein-anchoring transpeptidase ErfK/SrfK